MALLNFARFGINDDELSKFDFIIGFDLGHGEFSVSYWRLTGVESKMPEDLKINVNSDKKDFSVFSIDRKGEYSIGRQGIVYPTEGQLFSYFKVKPSRLDEVFEDSSKTKRQLMRRLVVEVLRHIRIRNTDSNFDGRGLLVVGCPSSPEWIKQDMDILYSEVFSDVGQEVGMQLTPIIMPESRASLVKVYKERSATDKNFVRILHNGVIVFDEGSSTTDSTSINFSTNIQKDDSIPLGASLIEDLILNRFCTKYGCRRKDLLDPKVAILHARQAKEAFYASKSANGFFSAELKNGEIGAMKLDEDLMYELTHKEEVCYSTDTQPMVIGTWADLFREFLLQCRGNWLEQVGNDKFEGVVLLTGGASRMKFIKDIAEEVFPDAEIIVDGDPSFCVSRGLAWATNTDLQAVKMVKKAKDEIKKALSADLNNLRERIATNLDGLVCDYIEEKLISWVKNGDNTTLSEMLYDATSQIYNLKGDKIRDGVKKALDNYLNNNNDNSIRSIIVNTINSLYETIFPGKIDNNTLGKFNITQQEWNGVVGEIGNINDLAIVGIIEHLDLESGISRALKNNFFVILGVYLPLWIITNIWDFLFDTEATESLENFFSENRDRILPKEKRQEILSEMRKNKKKTKELVHKSIVISSISEFSRYKDGESLPSTEKVVINEIMKNIDGIVNRAIDNVSLYF